jgi:hypothetical protein
MNSSTEGREGSKASEASCGGVVGGVGGRFLFETDEESSQRIT